MEWLALGWWRSPFLEHFVIGLLTLLILVVMLCWLIRLCPRLTTASKGGKGMIRWRKSFVHASRAAICGTRDGADSGAPPFQPALADVHQVAPHLKRRHIANPPIVGEEHLQLFKEQDADGERRRRCQATQNLSVSPSDLGASLGGVCPQQPFAGSLHHVGCNSLCDAPLGTFSHLGATPITMPRLSLSGSRHTSCSALVEPSSAGAVAMACRNACPTPLSSPSAFPSSPIHTGNASAATSSFGATPSSTMTRSPHGQIVRCVSSPPLDGGSATKYQKAM